MVIYATPPGTASFEAPLSLLISPPSSPNYPPFQLKSIFIILSFQIHLISIQTIIIERIVDPPQRQH